MSARAVAIAATVSKAADLAQQWQRKVAEDDRRYTPWMPFNTFAFAGLVFEALPAVTPVSGDIRALEIGCGPGPNLLILRDVFGTDATGFDRVPEYVAAARSLGLKADDADAEHYAAYGKFQLIWFNRVARDAGIQARTEARVWRDAAPGTVIICANLEDRPPASWLPVLDDWEVRRGIWAKPGTPAAGW